MHILLVMANWGPMEQGCTLSFLSSITGIFTARLQHSLATIIFLTSFGYFSCLPNSVLVFEGRLAVVRAMQHIPKGTEVNILWCPLFDIVCKFLSVEGRYAINGSSDSMVILIHCYHCFLKVLISYVDIAGSTLTRQKALKEQYYFACACSRCIKLVLWIAPLCFLA